MFFVPVFVFAESLNSPTWGFWLDLPEGYEYVDGDGKDRFSFSGPAGAKFDLVVYNGTYAGIKEMADDVGKRLSNQGDVDLFKYKDKQAAFIELNFGAFSGWGLCVELGAARSASGKQPMLLALAYGPASENGLLIFHFSALDSIVPSEAEKRYPGPISEYTFPRGERKQVPLAVDGLSAMIYENDAQAAQTFVEREYKLMTNYLGTPLMPEAWRRYYRLVYRDSFDRVTDAVSALARNWGGPPASGGEARRVFAQKALTFVQGFTYERHPEGSDFVNLVSAVTEGRGDCDSRVLLWAIILANSGIRTAMMVSPVHNHAMGLADITGIGARFEAYGVKWLVAETTASVDIGLIRDDVNDPAAWLGVVFE